MGCSCCRMVKSFSGDPTIPEDVTGHKHDPSTNSLVPSYQCHRLSEDGIDEKEGFQNYGYVSSSPTKFDIDNNHINHTSPNQQKGGESNLYILQPDGGTSTNQTAPVSPSAPPLSTESMLGTEAPKQSEKFRDSGLGNNGTTDEGDVGDTADDESVISVDIHTSSTSLSSTDTKLADDVDESITDAMVAEALAALEAATAGEEYE